MKSSRSQCTHKDILPFEKRLGELQCKHHPHRRTEMVCLHQSCQILVCVDCLDRHKEHEICKVTDISSNFSTLAYQIEDNHTSAVADTEAHLLRIQTCIDNLKRRVHNFESNMRELFSNAKQSQNFIRAESAACLSAQLLEIERRLSQGLPMLSNPIKACRNLDIKYCLSNASAWNVVNSIVFPESSSDEVRPSAIAFPTVCLGQSGILHCGLEPCPKWSGVAGSEFTFLVRISDRKGQCLPKAQSILTQIRAECKEGGDSLIKVLMTENSYALVKVHVEHPAERVLVMVTVNNLHTLVTPPIKFVAMPVVRPDVWQKAADSVFPISGHAAASFRNKIYTAGGISEGKIVRMGSVFSIECLEWVETFQMPEARTRMGMVECNGRLWVMGGCVDETLGKHSGSMEIYDCSKCVWERGPNMPVRSSDFAAISHKGCIYVIGGSASPLDTHVFNCQSSTWITLSSKMK